MEPGRQAGGALMAETDISICAAALRLIGAEPIASFDEGTPAADACALLYPALRDTTLAAHHWNFALRVEQLARLADAPTGWRAAFAMPPDMIGAIGFFPDVSLRGPVTRYAWQDTTVVSDSLELWLVYLRRVPEGAWRPPFALLMRYALAAELAMPITEKTAVAEMWTARAYGTASEGGRGGQFRVAASADSREGPTIVLPPGPLVLARHGSGVSWR